MLVTCPHCNQTHENPGIHKLLIKGGLESVTVTPDANNHQVVVGDDQGTAELHLAPVVALELARKLVATVEGIQQFQALKLEGG